MVGQLRVGPTQQLAWGRGRYLTAVILALCGIVGRHNEEAEFIKPDRVDFCTAGRVGR